MCRQLQGWAGRPCRPTNCRGTRLLMCRLGLQTACRAGGAVPGAVLLTIQRGDEARPSRSVTAALAFRRGSEMPWGGADQWGCGPLLRLRRDLLDLVALETEAGHQALLAENERVDIVLQGLGRRALTHAFVDDDNAGADADLESVRLVELLESAGAREEHRVAVLLAARLETERGAGVLVVGDRGPFLEQRTLAVLPSDAEAGLRDRGEDQDGDRRLGELGGERHRCGQILQRRL